MNLEQAMQNYLATKLGGGASAPTPLDRQLPARKGMELRAKPLPSNARWSDPNFPVEQMHKELGEQWKGRGPWSNDFSAAMKPVYVRPGMRYNVAAMYNASPNKTSAPLPDRPDVKVPPGGFFVIDQDSGPRGATYRNDLSSSHRHERTHKDLEESEGQLGAMNKLFGRRSNEKIVKMLDYLYARNQQERADTARIYKALYKKDIFDDIAESTKKGGALHLLEMAARTDNTQIPNQTIPDRRHPSQQRNSPASQEELLSAELKQWAMRKPPK